MTAGDAGVGVRERLARVMLEALSDEDTQQGDWGPSYVADGSPASKPLRLVTVDGQVDLFAIADAILAAGFGDVAEAKASALESAARIVETFVDTRCVLGSPDFDWSVVMGKRGDDRRLMAEMIRTTDTRSVDDDQQGLDMNTVRPGCHCFMWDEDCPEHEKNGGGE